MMSSNLNKASILGAIIMMAAVCSVSISAQTQATANSLKASPNSTREISEATVERKTAPPAKGTDPTSATDEMPEVNPGSTVVDPLKDHSDTKIVSRAASEPRAATGKTAPASSQSAPDDEWQFQLTPYLWIASISGRAGIGNRVIDTNTSLTDSDVELNFGFMGTFEARKNKLVILTDLQYSDLSTEKGNPGPLFSSTRGSFKTFVLDPEVGYRFADNGKGAFVDVLGGVRYWHVNGDLQFRAGILPAVEVSRSRSWIDGVVGLRGKAALSQRWFVSGKADVGGGGSKFTYQLFGGAGVMVTKSIALIGGYRHLKVDYDKDGFLFDMALHGPILGLGFKF